MTRQRLLLLAGFVAVAAVVAVVAVPRGKSDTAPAGWALAWSDEFNGASNTPPDPKKWGYDTGNLGVNNELEYYTDSTDNVRQNGSGQLEIVARKEQKEGWDYTSGRILTRDKFTVQYGRIESRIKLPAGQGMWPAFWMLGSNIPSVGWPNCGEVDIMENIGREPSTNHGTIHGPGYSGADGLGAAVNVDSGTLADAYHDYAIEWSPAAITFFFDGKPYETQKRGAQPAADPWVYDHPFFLLLNVAVGGSWPGNPDSTTQFPQTMSVDWVRVYKRSGPDTTAPTTPGKPRATHRTPRSVTLSWAPAIDEIGVVAYDVFRNGKKVASTAKTAVRVTGLSPGARASFAVDARDQAGNTSQRSSSTAVTTCKASRKRC